MNEIMDIKEFAERICQYVKAALPQELSRAEVRTACLDIYAGGPRTVLLVIRPWNDVTTGFCLDRHYKQYYDGNITLEHAASEIINDRRIYSMPPDNSTGVSVLQGVAVIYA